MLATIFSFVGFCLVLCVVMAPIAFIIERWNSWSHTKAMRKYQPNYMK